MDYTTTARLSSWPTRFGVGKLCCGIDHLWQFNIFFCDSSHKFDKFSFADVTASILNVALYKQDPDFVKMHWYL